MIEVYMRVYACVLVYARRRMRRICVMSCHVMHTVGLHPHGSDAWRMRMLLLLIHREAGRTHVMMLAKLACLVEQDTTSTSTCTSTSTVTATATNTATNTATAADSATVSSHLPFGPRVGRMTRHRLHPDRLFVRAAYGNMHMLA